MKFLVVGLGSIGKRHIINLISLGVDPLDIFGMDIREARRDETKKKFGLSRLHSTIEELEDEKFDAAFICTPTSLHIQQAIWLANKGIHLFIEKPLGHNLEGIEKLIDTVRENNVQVLIGYAFRFSDHVKKLKELVEKKVVGKILYVRGEFSEYLPDWHPWEDYRSFYMAKKSMGGGSILDQSHILDLCHFLFGEVKEICCINDKISELEVEADDFAEMLLRFKSGLVGTVHQDMFGREHKKFIEIKCAEGNIFWDAYDLSVQIFYGKNKKYEKFTFGSDHNQMYINQTKHMLNIIENKETSLIPLDVGIHTMKVIGAAEKSYKEKKFIHVG